MKKAIFILIAGVIISLSTGCSINDKKKLSSNETTVIVDEEETEFDSQDEFLVEITKDDLIDRISNSEEVWVYVGRPNCVDCQKYYPKLCEYLKRNNIKILYLNTRVKASLKADMVTFLAENGVDEVPSIIHWKNYKVEKVYDMQKDEEIKLFEEEYMKCGGYNEKENY